MLAARRNGRIAVVLSQYGLTCSLDAAPCIENVGYSPDDAAKVVVRMVSAFGSISPVSSGRGLLITDRLSSIANIRRLLDVLDTDMRFGRFLTGADENNELRVAILGGDLADSYQYLPGEERTVLVSGIDYAVVGVIEDVGLGAYPIESVRFDGGNTLVKVGSNYVPLSQVREVY